MIKHSKEQAKEQYRHLLDEEKLKSTEFRYGKITKKVVIYRGENATLENGIEYKNVEDYLKSLVRLETEQFGNEEQKTKKQKIKNSKLHINTAISGNAAI